MTVMTTYLESSSGVADGGRTGLTAIATSILFFIDASIHSNCFDVS